MKHIHPGVRCRAPDGFPAGPVDRVWAVQPPWDMTESAATGDDYFTENPHADVAAEAGDAAAGTESPNTVEGIAEEVRDEIRLGHVEDEVSHVLEERLDEAGISMRPEDVEDLAEDIERDVSS
jgi:hypothetical protein